MIDLPPGFEGHPRWQGSGSAPEDDCIMCALWDEPAWFWHADLAAPGSLEESLARMRESLRLLGLEFLVAADRLVFRR